MVTDRPRRLDLPLSPHLGKQACKGNKSGQEPQARYRPALSQPVRQNHAVNAFLQRLSESPFPVPWFGDLFTVIVHLFNTVPLPHVHPVVGRLPSIQGFPSTRTLASLCRSQQAGAAPKSSLSSPCDEEFEAPGKHAKRAEFPPISADHSGFCCPRPAGPWPRDAGGGSPYACRQGRGRRAAGFHGNLHPSGDRAQGLPGCVGAAGWRFVPTRLGWTSGSGLPDLFRLQPERGRYARLPRPYRPVRGAGTTAVATP